MTDATSCHAIQSTGVRIGDTNLIARIQPAPAAGDMLTSGVVLESVYLEVLQVNRDSATIAG